MLIRISFFSWLGLEKYGEMIWLCVIRCTVRNDEIVYPFGGLHSYEL